MNLSIYFKRLKWSRDFIFTLYLLSGPVPAIYQSILEHFDTPVTVIYEGALEFPDNVMSTNGSIAIRVTNDEFCKALIKRLGKPIVSTSANVSGEPSPAFFGGISPNIIQNVDYAVHYRREDITPRQPSRLLRILEDGSFDIIRS